MSTKRLQVLMKDDEYRRLRAAARRQGLKLTQWVRRELRAAEQRAPVGNRAKKLAAVRAAVRHTLGGPAPEIEQMLEETERGYLGR